MVAVAVQRRVGLCCRPKQRKSILIWYQAAAWWTECKVRSTWQSDAEGLPVQAPIQEPEVRRIDVDKHAAGVQHREVERESLDTGGVQSKLVGGAECPLLDTRSTIHFASLRGEHGRFVHWNRRDQSHYRAECRSEEKPRV